MLRTGAVRAADHKRGIPRVSALPRHLRPRQVQRLHHHQVRGARHPQRTQQSLQHFQPGILIIILFHWPQSACSGVELGLTNFDPYFRSLSIFFIFREIVSKEFFII